MLCLWCAQRYSHSIDFVYIQREVTTIMNRSFFTCNEILRIVCDSRFIMSDKTYFCAHLQSFWNCFFFSFCETKFSSTVLLFWPSSFINKNPDLSTQTMHFFAFYDDFFCNFFSSLFFRFQIKINFQIINKFFYFSFSSDTVAAQPTRHGVAHISTAKTPTTWYRNRKEITTNYET